MISRKTTKAITDVYSSVFIVRSQSRGAGGTKTTYKVKRDALYDFLFERNYDAWFMNSAKSLPYYDSRSLREFIMRLHTGETVVKATENWSWPQRLKLGQKLLQDLAEDIIVYCADSDNYISSTTNETSKRLVLQLELDGYQYQDGKLYVLEATVIDIEEEEGVLKNLVALLSLDHKEVINHHLDLSGDQYVAGNWGDSISNSRKYLEAILQEVAAKYKLFKTGTKLANDTFTSPGGVRDYLASSELLESKEKEAIAKVYGLLSETGGHPYVAEKDQARLMRNLALTFSQFVLLRLQGAINR